MEVSAASKSAALLNSSGQHAIGARGEEDGAAIVTGRTGRDPREGGGGLRGRVRDGSIVAYGEQRGIRVVVARSSRRATVAAMNFGACPRTKAIYIRSVR
ncbi:hypothetical protein M406DRAFT_356523 [Cryphonectria parasitica EP155]|uniref:Uncharacterized protein n=1 Tax=Cryphonectria parasitica (strain ATCC 38755 / EP155) TaxID=660469 RepID=A0A9P5CMQ3_CRYP1|nr:uncharacterized protein M406DRAFT_356523 [Cryphonectria parasitica EP155]KAF3764358.1 hypothetical protein M406DRAFT_356523 [Cryphonectria parasitica EP155]